MGVSADTIRFLTALPPFAGVDATTIKTIAARCRPMSRHPGESLFMEGDPCRDLYILAAGRVKCYRASPEGREQILKIFERPGDIFCTTSAFSTGSHIVTAEAMSETTLHVIDLETMTRVAREQPAVALALVTAAGDQLRSLVGLADDLSLKTATARVAKLLCERARAEGGRQGTPVRLRRDGLREEEIASMVGTVRVHVSRSLKTLAGLGAIRLEREVIIVSDVKVLERFSDSAGR
ncbi:MAG: Crp/Fnr family transcriptional regulator [Candidatus Rokubacteria bacterium]|nr:Crp/Fnr family transcriptional regulator [Candidatus Rokubacteria bacterium]MBI4253829.1 Crp/Fnr family transcriptional regulator [Candidatus Rokubacteria bacterium]